MIGETILHYKILEKLGEGGMGEVFKAQDTKLDRFVALKFLPSNLTSNEEQKSRFIQEAKTASAMNHPNICTIYDIQENNGQLFIVMEFVDGITLKDKLGNLSEKQSLEISVQVAEGLAAAHEKGIIHRDIKPENIMIRLDGIVQIMDFGLAKLYSDKNTSRLTKVGTTMGTLGYMSPEQIQGFDVDHRTDIFSFGIVLYEMFAGNSPFKGMHETAIMYEIVNVEAPPLSTIKNDIDPELDRIILECLEKDKDERCQSAKELAKDLRKVKKSTGHRKSRVYNVNSTAFNNLSNDTQKSKPSGTISIEAFNKRFYLGNIFRLRNISWIIVVLLLVYIFLQAPWKKVETSNTILRFSTQLDKDTFFGFDYPALNISRDGTKIVYNANSKLYLKNLSSLDAVEIPNTENAVTPVFSPDGNSIAFFQLGKLKRVSLNGGSANILATTDNVTRGLSWGSGNYLAYSPNTISGIFIIPENGGAPKQITFIDSTKSERTHRWPQFLPDGKNLLFTVGYLDNPDYYEDADIDIVNIESGERKTIIKGASSAKYINTGQIIYSKSGTLFAINFDLDKLEVQGQAVPVVEGVNGDLTSGAMHYSISDNGTLSYIPGEIEGGSRSLILVNENGENKIDLPPDNYLEPRLSPDGKQLAVVIRKGLEFDIWICDLVNKTMRKFTFGGQNRTPVWSPDEKKIAYLKVLAGNQIAIYTKNTDGSSKEEEVYKGSNRAYLSCWSKDGSTILLQRLGTGGGQGDIDYLKLDGENRLYPYLNSKYDEFTASFSPDSKWVAYVSSESGTYQVYVQSFPDKNGKQQLSTNTVTTVIWGKDGKYIYYDSNSSIFAVPVTISNTIIAGKPKEVARGLSMLPVDSGRLFDVTPDNKYILTTKPAAGSVEQKIVVVANWFEEVKKLTQTNK